jgi:hypothetical protein
MKYQILVKNETTNKLEKYKVIEAPSDNDAEDLAASLNPYDVIQLRRIIKLSCYHIDNTKTKCGYTWEYKGARTKSATCPNCHKQVYISRATHCK